MATNQGESNTGYGSELASEAWPEVLPTRGASPRRPARGLHAEQISGSAFTAPRAVNRRTWTYRIRPSVLHHRGLVPTTVSGWLTAPDPEAVSLGQARWRPEEESGGQGGPLAVCFLDGVRTVASNGDAHLQLGGAVHDYAFHPDLGAPQPIIMNADGDLVLVPRVGALRLESELGPLVIEPGSIGILPRGIKARVRGSSGEAHRGWLLENYGDGFVLPEPGPIGINALALPQDFIHPSADPETEAGPHELVVKADGRFSSTRLDHSPLDVAAWRGNYAPCVYDLRQFCPVGPVLFDHPDPSLGTVLTSPSDRIGTANLDLVVFRERWLVAEETFRPPYFHRNTMSELMLIIDGSYDARPDQRPGSVTLHNQFAPHGPDQGAWDAAVQAGDDPVRLPNGLSLMVESRYRWRTAAGHVTAPGRDQDYLRIWDGIPPGS